MARSWRVTTDDLLVLVARIVIDLDGAIARPMAILAVLLDARDPVQLHQRSYVDVNALPAPRSGVAATHPGPATIVKNWSVLTFIRNERNSTCYSVHVKRTEERAIADLIEALESLRYPLSAHVEHSDGADLVAQLPDGKVVPIEVKALRTVTPDLVPQIVDRHLSHGVTGVVVADQVTPAARDALAQAGWGWLDRRGHLGLVAGPLMIDMAIKPLLETSGQPATRALETSVGLDVAVALLSMPNRKRTIRSLVDFTGRSMGAVHQAMRGLKGENLIDAGGQPLYRELFWEAADRWRPERVALAGVPRPGDARRTEQLHLGLDDIPGGVGWALCDVVAANVFGAPAPVSGDYPADFYVPDTRSIRVARAVYGEPMGAELRGATVAIPPVKWVCEHRVDAIALGRDHPMLEFGFVHPVIAALDLAADPSRGREILDSWNPPAPYVRVW